MSDPYRLIGVNELGDGGVAVVEDTPHGDLAVGLSNDTPFAVSNRCRHLRASLGEGCVTTDGRLECPWHKAQYDVRTGEMTRGPQGAFRPLAGPIRKTMGAVKLKRYETEVRDDAIWLV